jgi:RNA polymerase-binding transcription factor DksA
MNHNPPGRYRGLVKDLFFVDRLLGSLITTNARVLAARDIIQRRILKTLYIRPGAKCLECGNPIPFNVYRNYKPARYCSRKCSNRVEKRVLYERLRETDPVAFAEHVQAKNERREKLRKKWRRTGRCGNCGGINDNEPFATCERCLIKARREMG